MEEVVENRNHEMTTQRIARDSFLGSWRIVEMGLWERKDIDELGPARIRFNRDGTGELRFLAVQGGIDCRFEMREGKPFVGFSWSGFDDMEETCGRGWAELEAGRLTGRLFFHLGDDSAFTAVRHKDRKWPREEAVKNTVAIPARRSDSLPIRSGRR